MPNVNHRCAIAFMGVFGPHKTSEIIIYLPNATTIHEQTKINLYSKCFLNKMKYLANKTSMAFTYAGGIFLF